MKKPLRRHRFEPARLVLGLALLLIAGLYLLRVFDDAGGADQPPLWLLATLVLAALVVSGVVAAVTLAVRRRRECAGRGGRRC